LKNTTDFNCWRPFKRGTTGIYNQLLRNSNVTVLLFFTRGFYNFVTILRIVLQSNVYSGGNLMALSANQWQAGLRTQLANILLQQSEIVPCAAQGFSQREMALRLGETDWETVHNTLLSLEEAGAVRLERNRLIINKKLLQQAAGLSNKYG
jgi:hypothetical protein